MGVETVGYIRNGITPEELAWKIEKYIKPSKLKIDKSTTMEEGSLDNEHLMLEESSVRWYKHAWISLTSASGDDFLLTYIYSNNTHLEELHHSIVNYPEDVPAHTTHAVRLSFGAREESQRMMRRIVALFGGYYVPDDSIGEVSYVPQRDACKE